MVNKRVLCLLSVLLPACLSNVVALEPRAKNVKIVHETDKPLRCDVLGKISGTSRSDDEKEARTGAENDFRNQAAAFKANFALVEADRHGPVGTSSQQDFYLGGKALMCQTEEMEEAADKAAAEERAEKEKAEADKAQQEAEEKKAAKANKK